MAGDIALEWEKYSIGATLQKSKGVSLSMPSEDDINWKAERCVYVLRFLSPYAIEYEKGKSHVCYIGSGRAWRILAHGDGWLSKLPLLLPKFKGYDFYGCEPRYPGRGHGKAYRNVEEDLIAEFKMLFGERPLFNRRLGAAKKHYTYGDKDARKIRKIFALTGGKTPSYSIKSINLLVNQNG